MSAARADLAELLGPRVVHPEAALEVDLAGVVAALEQDLDGLLRVVAGGNAGQADTDARHTGKLPGARTSSLHAARPARAEVEVLWSPGTADEG